MSFADSVSSSRTRHDSHVFVVVMLCITFQWLLHIVMSALNVPIEIKPINFINPYILFALIICLYALTLRITNRTVFSLFFLLFVIVGFGLWKYHDFSQFPGNFIKFVQYFYGVIIVFVGAFLLLRRLNVNVDKLPARIVRATILAFSIASVGELVLANFVFPPGTLFIYPRLNIEDALTVWINLGPIQIRPFGLSLTPQANSVTLVSMIVLAYLYHGRKFDRACYIGMLSVFLTFSGTGILFLLVFLSYVSRYRWLWFGFLVVLLLSSEFLPGEFFGERLSMTYLIRLYEIFEWSISSNFENFSPADWMLGSAAPSFNSGTGLTSDWGYVDVVYEFGFVGLLLYLLTYYKLLKFSMPAAGRMKNDGLVLLILLFNFHYPALNYYVAQMTLGILAAMNIHSRSRRQLMGRQEVASTVGFGVPGVVSVHQS
jgi:hypothetical protein